MKLKKLLKEGRENPKWNSIQSGYRFNLKNVIYYIYGRTVEKTTGGKEKNYV